MGSPRPQGGSRRFIRHYTATKTSVGAAFLEAELTVPAHGLIRRVRANVTAGTAINQVAVQIREATGGSDNQIVASYPLQSEALDDDISNAPLYYQVPSTSTTETAGPDTPSGVLYVAVKVDDSTTDHTIAISLDIEAVE